MNTLDLNLLRVLVLVHETGSLTRTAALLQITQPSVSHALSRLRRHFGEPLFRRGRLGMEPTALASELYVSFKESLGRIDRAIDSTRAFDPAASDRRFRICLTDVGEMSLLPQIIERMAVEAPSAEIEVVPMQIEHVEDWLISGRVDAAITSSPVPGAVRSTAFMEDSYGCLVRRDFPLVDGRMTLEQFLGARHAVTATSTGHLLPERVMQQLDLHRTTTVTLHHFSVLPHIVHRCGLVAIIPKGTTEPIVTRWPLTVVDLPFPVPSFEVRLHWQARDRDTEAQLWFRRTILAALTRPAPAAT